jgi:hypothetical protein
VGNWKVVSLIYEFLLFPSLSLVLVRAVFFPFPPENHNFFFLWTHNPERTQDTIAADTFLTNISSHANLTKRPQTKRSGEKKQAY